MNILKKLNLPQVNFRSLRHMFATRCVALGIDVKTLSEILGHSSVKITLDRYVHSSMERKQSCMKLFPTMFWQRKRIFTVGFSVRISEKIAHLSCLRKFFGNEKICETPSMLVYHFLSVVNRGMGLLARS